MLHRNTSTDKHTEAPSILAETQQKPIVTSVVTNTNRRSRLLPAVWPICWKSSEQNSTYSRPLKFFRLWLLFASDSYWVDVLCLGSEVSNIITLAGKTFYWLDCSKWEELKCWKTLDEANTIVFARGKRDYRKVCFFFCFIVTLCERRNLSHTKSPFCTWNCSIVYTDHIWELFSLALIFGFTFSSQSSSGIGGLGML